MGIMVGAIKTVTGYRRSRGDWMIAGADGATAIIVWRASTSILIGGWELFLTWGHRTQPLSDETFRAVCDAFSSTGMVIALIGLRQIMAFAMRFHAAGTTKEALLIRFAVVSMASLALALFANLLLKI